jgi:hypothetical protein
MRLIERRCEVCGGAVDPEQTSAHHARVLWLCTEHGLEFHARELPAKAAATTAECWRLIDAWLQQFSGRRAA